jgi:putative transposase
MQTIKEKTSHILMMQFASLWNHYSGQEMWSREYFCATSGNVTDDMIKQYIENQNTNTDKNFTVE